VADFMLKPEAARMRRVVVTGVRKGCFFIISI
jgi:hypothetical protein